MAKNKRRRSGKSTSAKKGGRKRADKAKGVAYDGPFAISSIVSCLADTLWATGAQIAPRVLDIMSATMTFLAATGNVNDSEVVAASHLAAQLRRKKSCRRPGHRTRFDSHPLARCSGYRARPSAAEARAGMADAAEKRDAAKNRRERLERGEEVPVSRSASPSRSASATPPTEAIGMAEIILNQSFNLDRHALAELESYAQAVALETPYHHAAVADFLAKKPLGFVWERFGRDGKM